MRSKAGNDKLANCNSYVACNNEGEEPKMIGGLDLGILFGVDVDLKFPWVLVLLPT